MKRKILSFILGSALFLGVGCAKPLPDETVALKMAEAICSMTARCLPQLPADPSCSATVKNSYLTAMAVSPKKGKVSEKELDRCLAEIRSMDCQVFGQSTPPAACRFLKGTP